jgi:tetratricopeptide (TPR) repeat protein
MKVMRVVVSMFLCVFMSITVSAQYTNGIIRLADSLYNLGKFKRSLEFYNLAFKGGDMTDSKDLYNAACSAALDNDKDRAIEYLSIALQTGSLNVDILEADPDFRTLHEDMRWKLLIERAQKKADEISNDYDKQLQDSDRKLQMELLSIWSDDQKIRERFIKAKTEYGINNSTVDSLGKMMKAIDSINVNKVTKILDTEGWVGKNKIGAQANEALFLVIQHSDLGIQEKYLPMMREAVKNGNANSSSLALLEDRVALRQGHKQIYGSQIYWDKKTNKYFVAPLLDPDNVNRRRIKVGLVPLDSYVKMWDIIWNAEEYKKQMPEIEIQKK